MTDHHRPQHPVDGYDNMPDLDRRASDDFYARKRPGLIRKYLGETAGVIAIVAIVFIALVVMP